MNSARELLQFNFDADAFARRAPRPIAIPPKIVEDLEKIKRNHNSMGTIPKSEDLRQICRLFHDAVPTGRLGTEFDSIRRIRQLAWALTYSEDKLPRIVDTPELRDALQLIENRFPNRVPIGMVLSVFDTLLKAWDTKGASVLRVFVSEHLANYEGRRRFVQDLRANLRWYCEENGATQLAMNLLRTQENLSNVWSYLNLPKHTHGYRYFGAVAKEFVSLSRRLDRESVADIVTFVKMHKDDKTSRAIVSRTIENLGFDAPEDLRQPVRSYVFREWEDPRLASGDVRWLEVSPEAKEIFTKWITEEDLRFFFDVVAQACNDQKFAYRKAFWLAYFEHISFCRPVLRKDVQNLFRNNPQAMQYYHERRPATLTGAAPDQHAFIIQMGDHTFVEFSTAAACYVYDEPGRPFYLGDSEYPIGNLRRRGLETYWQRHDGSEIYKWQSEFARWIRRELEIKPMRDYRLGNATDRETNSVAELLQGLGNKQTWRASSRALVRIGRPAVPAVIRALRNGDPRVRFRAINTLSEMGRLAEEAIPILRELRQLDRMDYVRDRANSALGRMEG